MQHILHVGDRTADGGLTVIAEDKLCIQVDSFARGVHGIRTISKQLLDEWIDGLEKNPSASSEELRDKLVGKSKIDRFEYGYRSTLYKLAQMALGVIGVVHVKTDYSAEFCNWFAENRGKGSDTTAKKYLSYFKTLTSESQPFTHSHWPGLYRIMYGSDAGKDVVEIGDLEEFNRIYGGIVPALETKAKGEGMTDEGFQHAVEWFWRPEVKPHTCVTSALKAYADFLKWRKEKKAEEMLAAGGDRLTVALKLYARERGASGPTGWGSYDEWTHGVRAEFAKVNEGLVGVAGFDYGAYIRKYGISWQVANTKFSGHGEAEQRAVLGFLREQKESPKAVSWYLDEGNRLKAGGVPVSGMGAKTVLYFLSELHPGEFAAWTEPTYEMLAFLGLHKGAVPSALTMESYEDCKGKQRRIVERMRELGIGKASDDGSAADYRTVNEFLLWVKENQEAVQEEAMKSALKPVKSGETLRHGTRKLEDAFAGDGMLKRLAAALRTKPFAILAGHSGTGKSQLVRRLAYMTCNNERLAKEGEGKTAPGNFCMVQVKPNWHDSTDLLGYYSEMGGRHFVNTPFVEFVCKAYAYPETPFFVCLDEMNLAPVEQYFAEYLSAIESLERKGGVWVTDPLVEVDGAGETDENGRPKADWDILGQVMKGVASTEAAEWIAAHGLTIPKNLFVVGTVNMDETTCQFSRKVLDRAMTLLMNEVKFGSMAASKKASEEELLDEAGIGFFLDGDVRGEVGAIESGLLDGINEPLANTAFMVAYRFANEYALYEAAWAKLKGVDLASAAEEDKKKLASEALDQVVLMKLLPRIHGERSAVKAIFEGGKKDGKETPGLKGKLPEGGLSVRMMDDILARGDEYLTFWP